MNADDPRHGTNAGYQAHHKWNVPICDPCRTAHAEHHRKYKARMYLARRESLLVDPTPTVRRIRALQAMGWPLREIERRIGLTPVGNRLWNITQSPNIHVDTAARIAAIYDELHMRVGPSERSRQLAVSRGWAPPLAWDDIDDFDEIPTGLPSRKRSA